MKKNLLLVILMALVVVNIVLTAVMMFSMMSTNKKTAKLVTDIASVLNLQLDTATGEENVAEVPLSDLEMWNLDGSMTIPLKSEDGKNHYVVFDISFAMNTKAEGYKTYGANIDNYDTIVRDTITQVVSKHTLADCTDDFDTIRAEILTSVQNLFDKEFIHKVAISGIVTQ